MFPRHSGSTTTVLDLFLDPSPQKPFVKLQTPQPDHGLTYKSSAHVRNVSSLMAFSIYHLHMQPRLLIFQEISSKVFFWMIFTVNCVRKSHMMGVIKYWRTFSISNLRDSLSLLFLFKYFLLVKLHHIYSIYIYRSH